MLNFWNVQKLLVGDDFVNQTIADKIKNIETNTLLTKIKSKMYAICKISPEKQESFFKDVLDSIETYKKLAVEFTTAQTEKLIFKKIHVLCCKILEERGRVYSRISSGSIRILSEAEHIQIARHVKYDVEKLANLINELPAAFLIFLKERTKYSCEEFPDIEALEDPLRQHQIINFLCGLCVSGGHFKKGRNRPNGKTSKPTLEIDYSTIGLTKLQRGRPKNSEELELCCHLGIDYYKATERLPYRQMRSRKESDYERGPFVALLKEIFIVMGVDYFNTDELVKKYSSLRKIEYKLYSTSSIDRMTSFDFKKQNAIVFIKEQVYFIRNGELIKNVDNCLKNIKLEKFNFKIEEFFANGKNKIDNTNKIKFFGFINLLTLEAELPSPHMPSLIQEL